VESVISKKKSKSIQITAVLGG